MTLQRYLLWIAVILISLLFFPSLYLWWKTRKKEDLKILLFLIPHVLFVLLLLIHEYICK